MKRIFLVFAMVILMFSLSACSKGYENIDNEQLKEMLSSDVEYYFIDVRTTDEFYEERIPGFTKNIDYYKLKDNYSMIEDLDKNIPVVIMCNSGNRSVDASKIFVKEGFTTVYNLTEGIQGWNGETE